MLLLLENSIGSLSPFRKPITGLVYLLICPHGYLWDDSQRLSWGRFIILSTIAHKKGLGCIGKPDSSVGNSHWLGALLFWISLDQPPAHQEMPGLSESFLRFSGCSAGKYSSIGTRLWVHIDICVQQNSQNLITWTQTSPFAAFCICAKRKHTVAFTPFTGTLDFKQVLY